MNVVLLGPPGAGKGTQAKRIVEQYALVHLSSGDILRAERRSGSELGQKLTRYMDAGELVPDELVTDVMVAAARRPDVVEQGFLLDGFPRTEQQAKDLDAALTDDGRNIDAVVSIEVDASDLVERLTGRRSCSKCGAVYHTKFNPPSTPDKCDTCGPDGPDLVQRTDDTDQVVSQRISVYEKQTQPLVHYYEQQQLLHRVDGAGDIDKVTVAVFDILEPISARS